MTTLPQESTYNVALVTGSSRRLGAAIAQYLHQRGYNIVIHYRSHATDAQALRDTLNAKRAHSAIALQADLMSLSTIQPLIHHTLAAWGRLDVLVNNAAVFSNPWTTANENDWQTLMDTNLKAPFFLARRPTRPSRNKAAPLLTLLIFMDKNPYRIIASTASAKPD